MDKQQNSHSKTAKVVGLFLASAMAVTAYAGCSTSANDVNRSIYGNVYSSRSSGGVSFFSWHKSDSHSTRISSGSRGGIGSSSGSSS